MIRHWSRSKSSPEDQPLPSAINLTALLIAPNFCRWIPLLRRSSFSSRAVDAISAGFGNVERAEVREIDAQLKAKWTAMMIDDYKEKYLGLERRQRSSHATEDRFLSSE
jgi:hypothetical protein